MPTSKLKAATSKSGRLYAKNARERSLHVKWEKRHPENGLNGNNYRLKAVLVEKYGNDGMTNQRVIEHLGSIGQKFLVTNVSNMRAFHQGIFWAAVDKKLDQLKLDEELRKKIEADISETVSRPDEDWALWGVTCIPKFDP